MDKLLKRETVLVLACWTTEKDNLKISIKPYKIRLIAEILMKRE